MKQVLQGLTRLKPTILLYLGTKDHIHQISLSSTKRHAGLRLIHIGSEEKIVSWLAAEVEKQEIIGTDYTILCDYQHLKSNDFALLHSVNAHPKLKFIPFFVHTEEQDEIDCDYLLSLGVDDCLRTPLDWQNVERKVDFWLTYKEAIKSDRPRKTIRKVPKTLISPAKRMFDLIVASTLLLLLSPLFLLIALLIKIDSKGSIFYKSKRVGMAYQTFDFWKFRSMYQDADERLHRLLHLNQYDESDSCNNCFIKLKNDPRITKVGRFIRKTSLDELPQLFNVLKGEMSLVGNRPLPPYEAILMVNDYRAARFLAPAGLTGLWQVSKRGKSDMSTEERVELDITYARNQSFWYDIKLLIRTLPAMIQEEDV
ncbi:MAG: sugar transferase [Bacteroidota bacterium]